MAFNLDLGTLVAHIKFDGAQTVNNNIQTMTVNINRAAKEADRFASSVDRMAKAALGYIGLRQSLRVIESWKNAARDAYESENLFAVSMGKSADAARTWSQEMGKALGLNEYALRRQVGTFNVMLGSMGLSTQASYEMAKGMTQLAHDMASFYNLSPEQAFEKIQSGIVGMPRPLQDLGIIINETAAEEFALRQGWIKHGEQLSEVGKIYARYGALIEQTTAAQGDLIRTADSAANMERRVQAQFELIRIELGNNLLPVWQRSLMSISEWMRTNQEDIKAWAEGAVASIGWVAKSFLKIQDKVTQDRGIQWIEHTAKERYMQAHPEDVTAFQGTWEPVGREFVYTRPKGPAYKEEYQRLLDQLKKESADLMSSTPKGPVQPSITGKYEMPDFAPPKVEPMDLSRIVQENEEAAQKVEKSWEKAADERLEKNAQMYRDMEVYDDAWFTAQLAQIMAERREYYELGLDRVHIEEWYTSQVKKLRQQQKEGPYSTEAAQKAERIVQANAQLASGLKGITGSYEAQLALLDDQKRRYEQIGADLRIINAWYERQVLLLDIAIAKNGTIADQLRAAAEELRMSAEEAGGPWYQFARELPNLLEQGMMNVVRDMDNWTDALKNMLKEIYFEAVRIAFIRPAAEGMASMFSMGASAVLGAFKPSALSIGRTGAPTGDYNVPGFAEGGIAWTPQLAMVAEKGPEVITPMSKVGGMGKVTVNFINESGYPIAPSRQEEYMLSDQRIIDVFVARMDTDATLQRAVGRR